MADTSSHSPASRRPQSEQAALSPLCIGTVGHADLTGCVDKFLGVATPNKALSLPAEAVSTSQDIEVTTAGVEDCLRATSKASWGTQDSLPEPGAHEWDLASLTLWHRSMLALLAQAEGVQRSAQLYTNDADRSRYMLQQFQADTGCDTSLSAWYLPHASWHYPSALISWHHDMHQLLQHRARSPSAISAPSYLVTQKQDSISNVRRKAAEAEKAAFIASAPTSQPGAMDAMAQHHRRVKFQALTQLDSKAANRYLAAGSWDVGKAMDVYLTACAVKLALPAFGEDMVAVFRDATLWRKKAAKKVQEVGIQAPAPKEDSAANNGWPAACLAAFNLPGTGRRALAGNPMLSPSDSVNSEQVFAAYMKESYQPDTPSSASSLGESHLDAPHTRNTFQSERRTLIASYAEPDTSDSEPDTPLAPHPDPSLPPRPEAWQPFPTGDSSLQSFHHPTTSFRSHASWGDDTTTGDRVAAAGYPAAPNLIHAMSPGPLMAPHHSLGSVDSIQSVPQGPTHPWGAPAATSLQTNAPSLSDVYQPDVGIAARIAFTVPEHDVDELREPSPATTPTGVPPSREFHTAPSQLRRSGAFTEYISPSDTGHDDGPDRAAIAAMAVAVQASVEGSTPEVVSRTVVTATSRPLSPSHSNSSSHQLSLTEAIHASLSADAGMQSVGTPRGLVVTPFSTRPSGIPSLSTSPHSHESNTTFPTSLPLSLTPASPRTVVSPSSHSSLIRSEDTAHNAAPVTPRAHPAVPRAGVTACPSAEVIHTHSLTEEGLLDDEEAYPLSPRDSATMTPEEPEDPPTLKVWTKAAQEHIAQQISTSEVRPSSSAEESKLTLSSVTLSTTTNSVGKLGAMDQAQLNAGESREENVYSKMTPAEPDVEVHVRPATADSSPTHEVLLQPAFNPGAFIDTSPPAMPSAPLSRIAPPVDTASVGSATSGAASSARERDGSSATAPADSADTPSSRGNNLKASLVAAASAISFKERNAPEAGIAAANSMPPAGEEKTGGGEALPGPGVEQYFQTSLRNWVDPVPHLLTSPLARGISAPGGLSEVVAPSGTMQLPDELTEVPPPYGTMELPPLTEGSPVLSHSGGPVGRRSGSMVEVPVTSEESVTSGRGGSLHGPLQYSSSGTNPANPSPAPGILQYSGGSLADASQRLRGSITNAGLYVSDYPAPTRTISAPSAWQNPSSHPSLPRQETGSLLPPPPHLSQSNSLHYRSLDDTLESVSTGGSAHLTVPVTTNLSPLNILSSSHGRMSAPESLQRSSTLPYRSVAAFDADFTLAGINNRPNPQYQPPTSSLQLGNPQHTTGQQPPIRQYTGSHPIGAPMGDPYHNMGQTTGASMGGSYHDMGHATGASMGGSYHDMGNATGAPMGAVYQDRVGAPGFSVAPPPSSMPPAVRPPPLDTAGQYPQRTGSASWARSSSSQALPPFLPDATPDYISSPARSHYTHMPQRSPSTDFNAPMRQSSMGGSGYGGPSDGMGSMHGVNLPRPGGSMAAGGPLTVSSGQLPHTLPLPHSTAGQEAGGNPRGRLQKIDSFDQPEWDSGRRRGTTNLDDMEIPNWF